MASIAYGQETSRYCDPLTSICYSSYTTPGGISYRTALPFVSKAQGPFDIIIQIVAPISNGWAALAWGGEMLSNPIIMGWANDAQSVPSSRMAFNYNVPQAYDGATYTLMRGSGANSTHWTLTVLCEGCSQWLSTSGNTTSLDPGGTATLAWAQSNSTVVDPTSNTTIFNAHNSVGTWTHNLALGRDSDFDTWVAKNVLAPPPVSTTTTTSRVTTTTTSVASTTTGSAAFPTSCSGVAAPRFPSALASGWKAVKIAGGLTTPRGVIVDSAGNLLIVQSGKGITVHTLSSNGCVSSTKTLVSLTSLNHGIYLSIDGKTLYASSLTTVYSWTYDANTQTVSSTSKTIVNGMNPGGHPSRTLVISPKSPNLLVIQEGSNSNIDNESVNIKTERAVVKVFDLNSVPSGGYVWTTGGYQAGYGLRNEVGLTFDGNSMLWGVENSSDDAQRTVNGQSKDIHQDNPAEELNYLGDVTVSNTKWYGYPTCFTVWQPSLITDRQFQTGDQFVMTPNNTFNDASCIQQSTPPRLSFQAHSAPLDLKFDSSFQNLYVSFHGSWDRSPATGYKVVKVPFSRAADGSYAPTAPSNSNSGYTDIFWNSDVTRCSTTYCFRPVGIVFNSRGRMFVTSDSAAEGELFMLGTA
ncbi:cellobiose dehydrogenase-like protein [Xylogone sp. PMI_703]|nr:cellobiose dehydrogenase-like protein [Xylogone sp. PMI_703]